MTLRVLEFGDNAAAGYCGRLYVQSGAEVIRVDSPWPVDPEPDSARARALDLYLHAGKQRLALDVSTPEGRERLDRLATHCDVLVTDLPAAALDALDWTSLGHADTPAVRVSITPFGLSGPYRDWQGHGAIVLAMGGYTALMGDPGRAPLTLPGHYAEYQAAQYAYLASLATLLQPEPTPQGHVIEVSLLETVLSLSQFTTVMWTCQGRIRSRHGNDWQSTHPLTMYPCKDGWFAVSAVPAFWEAFTRMLGRPDLLDDPRFATNDQRLAHRAELDAIVLDILGRLTMAEVLERGQRRCRVPTGTLFTMARLLDDPHLKARFYWQTLVDPSGRQWNAPGLAFRQDPVGPQPILTVARPGAEAPDAVLEALARSRVDRRRPVMRSNATRPTARRHRPGPLAGIRIVDLTHVWAGPLATRILADLGADVLKIEAATARGTRQGLPATRGMYPQNDPGAEPWNRQGVLNKLNRNKLGLSLNLKHDTGRQIFLDLVAQSDVVIENFSAATMASLGLGYEVLQSARPDLIYVTMPGYGTRGPYRDFVAYGPSVEPMTGLTSLMGYSAQEPRATAMALPDAVGGVTAAAAVVSALAQRAVDGQGRCLDLSQHEATISLLGEYVLERQISGRQPPVLGNAHAVYAPHGTYRCRGEDDWIVIACRNPQEWDALCALANRGWEHDPRFATRVDRQQHRADLDAALGAWTRHWDRLELMAALQQRGVPAGAVMTAPEFMTDPHLEARGFFVPLGGDHIESVPYPGLPVLIDGRRGEGWQRAPKLGEHNEEVLRHLLGLDASEVRRLLDAGVLANRPPA